MQHNTTNSPRINGTRIKTWGNRVTKSRMRIGVRRARVRLRKVISTIHSWVLKTTHVRLRFSFKMWTSSATSWAFPQTVGKVRSEMLGNSLSISSKHELVSILAHSVRFCCGCARVWRKTAHFSVSLCYSFLFCEHLYDPSQERHFVKHTGTWRRQIAYFASPEMAGFRFIFSRTSQTGK